MLAFTFATSIIEGLCSTDVEPTPTAFPSSDPDEAYGASLDWGYGQVHERNSDGLVRVAWAFGENAPEWVEPTSLTDSRDLCAWGRRDDYLKLGGKLWADEQYWEPDGERRWKWKSPTEAY
jgi:hypothetical protein